MWETGRIAAIDGNALYEYHAKVYDEPSEWGLNGGRVSKLSIRKIGESEWLYNYDRSEDIPASDVEVESIVNIVLSKFA